MSNSHGNTGRDIRKFLRDNNIPVTADNVDRIGREVRRTQSENDRVEREAKERGLGTRDEKGEVTRERIERAIERKRRGG